MGLGTVLAALVIGALAGWLAGRIVEGYGLGLVGNIVVGILGAFLAGLVLPAIGLTLGGGTLARLVHATIGAVILLVLLRLVRRG